MYYAQLYQCPFFAWDEKNHIHGECGAIRFCSADSLKGYTEAYCANMSGWERCTLAQHLQSIYDKEDTNG